VDSKWRSGSHSPANRGNRLGRSDREDEASADPISQHLVVNASRDAFNRRQSALRLLKRKLEQLTGGQPETFRCIFLAHVGSTLLRRVGRDGEIDSTRRRVSGREIISHFVSAYADRIDSVVVFAPYREGLFMGQTRFRYALGDRDGEKSLVGHCLNSRHDLIERYRRVCGPGCRRPRSACARASIQAEGAWVGKRIHAIVLRQSGVSNFRDQCVQFPQE
jgi:hypothetical protein